MKKLLLLIILLALSTNQLSAQSTSEERAKSAIRQYFKETMNDYDSYVPVSYGTVDSLFSSPLDVDILRTKPKLHSNPAQKLAFLKFRLRWI